MVDEMIICAAATPKAVQQPAVPPQLVPLEAVRGQLNGKTFKEIHQLAESLHVTVSVGFVTQPDL